MSLTDRRSGRDWMAPGHSGEASDPPGEDADYVADGNSCGWDECFPTVAACAEAHWGGALRDHGALWGRPWSCRRMSSGVVSVYDDPRFRFRRALRLDGARLRVDYALTSRHDRPLPWLWSQHCLLAVRPGERITATGLGPWRDAEGQAVTPGPVQPASAGVAGKLFAPIAGRAEVAVTGPQGGIRFAWDAAGAGFAGLWFSYGGWPPEAPLHQLAIEPATRPVNRLSEAVATGGCDWLAPGASRHWQVDIALDI